MSEVNVVDKYVYTWLLVRNEYFPVDIDSKEYSYEDIFLMGKGDLIKKTGVSEKQAEYMLKRLSEIDIDIEYSKFISSGVSVVQYFDKEYPEKLLNIENPPRTLFYYGELPKDDIASIAVIGARNCSEYGRYMAKIISEGLCLEGIQIISGMALGIDGIAQMSALNSGGRSFGILGSGVDICYPRANKELYERLKNSGGVISEYPIGVAPQNRHFPARNRIISGLSDGVVVVEAKHKSGTIITVDAALSQGKDIFAVPGRATDALSVGCNGLIKQGAFPVQSSDDILDIVCSYRDKKQTIDMDYKKSLKKYEKRAEKLAEKKIELESDENMVYSCFDFDPISVSEIADRIDMDISKVSCLLIGLEMKGYLREVGRNSYVRAR